MSALERIADSTQTSSLVRKVPVAEIHEVDDRPAHDTVREVAHRSAGNQTRGDDRARGCPDEVPVFSN